MAVSLRVTGTWAELTADGSVAIPATPQAGDRMYLFARWKDFSITATVANWTELVEFADGAVGSGNGTGSVKVGCWYRDWQSGDTDPTIDFSASPSNASVVIIVMAKDAADSWLTPVAVTAAMTNWTNTSQTVSASSTANVLGDGVVMGLIGIRDDTAVMTRPTNGIDDAGGLVTWNGNYVEAPATHHSTTTGDDGAADLGYRLVTTGASGVTLHMTGTISATETGAALWVVQGVQVTLTVDNSAHLQSGADLALTQVHALAVANDSHAHGAESLTLTQVHETVIQSALHAHISDNLTFTQAHVLAAQNASHDHSAGNLTIEVIHHLAIQSADHACLSDNLTLQVIQHLEAGNSTHAHAAEDVALAQIHELLVSGANHAHAAQSPNARTFLPVFIDPGGDSVQAVGYFQTQVLGSGGVISFDTAQKVNGVGSYKFDSQDNDNPHVTVTGVMGAARRPSAWFRYTSVPDATATVDEFGNTATEYSGGGFTDFAEILGDNDAYATATPAKNSGQGMAFGGFGFASGSSGSIPSEAAIKLVKIRYERKYDTNTSIGISRVKWRIDGIEGPDHDNTDEPLVDTVVEVDVTADRDSWARSELADGVFEVIAEARRGDTDTEHTQSWDYVEVEVEYFIPFTIIGPSGEGLAFEIALIPKGDHVTLRLIDGDKVWYDGITKLFPDTNYRISWGHLLHDTNLIDIKLYVDAIEELSVVDAKCAGGISNLVNLLHGWVSFVGVNKVCWFDQFYIDDGDDLSDCGNVLSTHKGPATVNEDNWDTDGGTGAVNERPLSATNYKEHAAPIDAQYQTYNLQAASAGDINISGESLVGYMGWAWAQLGGAGPPNEAKLIVNGEAVERLGQLAMTPRLIRLLAASASYPSNARGIGMYVDTEFATATMFECGAVVAYEGPTNPDILLPRREVVNETLDTIIDDLRADPPDSYELCWQSSESDTAIATLSVSALYSEGGEPQYQTPFSITGSSGRMRIEPGLEVRIDLTVTDGSTYLTLWRRVNFD